MEAENETVLARAESRAEKLREHWERWFGVHSLLRCPGGLCPGGCGASAEEALAKILARPGARAGWTGGVRGSGRTTRMVRAAVAAAESGRKVIIAAGGKARPAILAMLEVPGRLNIRVTQASPFDPRSMRALRLPENPSETLVLVDHHSLETLLKPALEQLRRFDP